MPGLGPDGATPHAEDKGDPNSSKPPQAFSKLLLWSVTHLY